MEHLETLILRVAEILKLSGTCSAEEYIAMDDNIETEEFREQMLRDIKKIIK